MQLLQLIGQGAFIVASMMLGVKLLLLWQRTREVPELSLGVAFALGGGLGYVAWFALGIVGASSPYFHTLAVLGLTCTCVGALSFAIGVARIFRAGTPWPLVGVGVIGAVMAASFFVFAVAASGTSSSSFWISLMLCVPIYAWGAVEAFIVANALHKRARLGMADPIVVNRLAQWGVAGFATVAMFLLSFVSLLMHGPMPPPWVMALNAGLGLISATTIWLGFFPPRRLRERLIRAYAS